MAERIQITIRGNTLTAQLYENNTAKALYNMLPIDISMSRWGDEYYGDCGLDVQLEKDARAEMQVGELAIWPQGNALCIFFGPTPASRKDEPQAISPVNPIARIEGDIALLKGLPSSIVAEVKALD
jgi:hypothetical protein